MASLPIVKESNVITFTPYKFTRLLFFIAVFLFLASLTGTYLEKVFLYNSKLISFLIYFFDLAQENNIPTFFSGALLLTVSVVNMLIYLLLKRSAIKKNFKIKWFLLGIIFFYLSLDECLAMHERINSLRTILPTNKNGIFMYPWIIPYSFFFILSVLFFRKFVLSLPLKIKKLFTLSCFIYAGSAIGFEVAEGFVVNLYGVGNWYDVIFYSFEEMGEMLGVIIFIYAQLHYIILLNLDFSILLYDNKQQDDSQVNSVKATSIYLNFTDEDLKVANKNKEVPFDPKVISSSRIYILPVNKIEREDEVS